MKKIIALLLCCLFLFCCACSKDGESSGTESASESSSRSESESERDNPYVPPVYADTYIVKNGVSPYKIVIPQNASDDILFAVDELKHFFKLATNVTLLHQSDESVSGLNGKYLSIGETTLKTESGMNTTYSELGNDGCKVQTKNNTVVMCGATDEGTINAVYDFLNKQINLEIYAEDIYTYDRFTERKLVDLDMVDIPDIAFRSGGTFLTEQASKTAMRRYRIRSYWSGWERWGHTHFAILPPGVYWNDHPDWYNNAESIEQVTQLNWANQEMWDEFAENLKKDIASSSRDNVYYMLGHEDNRDAGNGKGYSDIVKNYEGSDTAMEIRFLNYVVRKINAWTAEYYPNKNIEFGMFAYYSTIQPPVKWDSQQNKYVPISDDVVLEDNLGIMIAPLDAHVSHGYCDMETNRKYAQIFEGWGVVAKRMQVWAYSTNFWDYYSPMNSWGSIAQNYRDYKRLGVTFLFEQGCLYKAPGFMELRQYLVSKLSWNSSLNEEKLISDFIRVYYGAGSAEMQSYFDLMRNKLTELEKQELYAWCAGYLRPNYFQSEYFSRSFLGVCDDLFEKALAKAEAAGDERAYKAIEAERLPLYYLMLNTYMSSYDSQTAMDMINYFDRVAEEHGYVYYNENKVKVSNEIIAKWISQVA